MTPAQMLEKFSELTAVMIDKMRLKNADYARGSDPFKNLRRHGPYGIVVRMDDKISRLDSLSNPKFADHLAKVKDESAEDTAMDLATYALLFILLRRETVGVPITSQEMGEALKVRLRELSAEERLKGGRPAALEAVPQADGDSPATDSFFSISGPGRCL